MSKIVLFKITYDEELMVNALKPFAKSNTRAKVYRFALQKTYENLISKFRKA